MTDINQVKKQIASWEDFIFMQENSNDSYYLSQASIEHRRQLEAWKDELNRLENSNEY
ncbi:MAG: hypothetical protein NC124_02095 [Clostridium sp.]|nr:hypothetical protein [Clostridium sp.]